MSRKSDVVQLLARLAWYCDTGFALALHLRYAHPSFLFQTYSQGWNDYYSENGLILSDPSVRWGIRETGAIRWEDIPDPDEAGVMESARRFGLRNGVCVSVGLPSSRSIAGLSRGEAPFEDGEIADLQGIVERLHALTDPGKIADAAEMAELRAIDPAADRTA